MLFKRFFCLVTACFISLQSGATQQNSPPATPVELPAAGKYEPTPEQLKLIDARRAFARQFFKSDIEYEFHSSKSFRAGTLKMLKVTKPDAMFFRAHMGEISSASQLLTFIKRNKALFQIDEETLLSLKDISEGRPHTAAVFVQMYKGLPVFDSIILAQVFEGISYIRSRLVPGSRLSLQSVKPQITPEKIVEVNWKGWLSEGTKFSVGPAVRRKERGESYLVPVTRTIVENGKPVVEKEEASVSLVVFPRLGSTRLAWCFEDWTAVYDAISGEMIDGEKGPHPVGLFPAIRASTCPYRVL